MDGFGKLAARRVIVVHGWGGGPGGDWLPWLRSELESEGCVVVVPAMPDTDEPNIKKWVDRIAKVAGDIDSRTFFIGHSIGCQTIMRFIEKASVPVAGAIFVAGWFHLDNLEDEESKTIAKPWLTSQINLHKIKELLPSSTLLISDNDPYNCFEENKKKFEKMGSEIIVVPKAGHFTTDDGFETFPQLLDVLKHLFSNS